MTYIGAATPPPSGQTWAQSITAWENLVGKPMTMRRSYEPAGNPPANVLQTQMQHDIGKRASLWSFKPTLSTPLATLNSLAQSIVDSGHTAYVIPYHEPVDNMSGPDFINLYQYVASPFRDRGIQVGPCFTNYSINLPYSNVQSALKYYWPGNSWVDFLAIDEYPVNEITSTKDAMDMTLRTRRAEQWADSRGIPLGLAEYGVEATVDAAKSDRWLRSVLQWMRVRNKLYRPLLFALYFQSFDSTATPPFDYRLNSHPEFVDAYKDMLGIV